MAELEDDPLFMTCHHGIPLQLHSLRGMLILG